MPQVWRERYNTPMGASYNLNFRSGEIMVAHRGLLLQIILLCVVPLGAYLPSASEAQLSDLEVAVLSDSFSSDYPGRAEVISRSLAEAGLKTTFISGDELSDERAFSMQSFDCLVLPDAALFPAKAIPSFLAFLRSGGDLVVIGGPLFDKLVYLMDGRWQTRQEILGSLRPHEIVLDLSKVKKQDWHHATSNPEVESRLVTRQSDGERWADFWAEKLPGWDTYRIKLPANAFPKGHSFVCFRASGGKNTPNMALEIQERDGSRWFAVVPLNPKTRSYARPVEEFKFWSHGSPPGRGGRRDRLNLSNAESLVIGLARSHNILPAKGPFSFSISSIGSASSPLTDETPIPVLETLYPWYKTYVTTVGFVMLPSLDFLRLPRKTEVVCPIWRSRGLGIGNPTSYRWIPLAFATEGPSDLRGPTTVASLTLNFEGEFANSHWLQIGFREVQIIAEHSGTLASFIAEHVRKMHLNVFIRSGGVGRASYFEGQEVTIGCVLNRPAPESWRVLASVWWIGKLGSHRTLIEKTLPVSGKCEVHLAWQPPSGDGESYQASIELLDGEGTVVDTVTHDFTSLADPSVPQEEIVRVEGCHFVLKGKRWYPHGINYWPSNWGGREPREFWGHWLSPALYDPLVVERDLSLARELGMNSISIQLNRPEQIPAVNDFLFRCREHGIYVNLFLAGGHPLRPNFGLLTTFLREGRFAGDPAIYAYDIAWEPHLGEEGQRKRLDPEWRRWIEERYGDIENAEKDWKFELRKENGGITTPTQHQILNSGSWNVMVAAYRRFLDDLISRRYREVTRRIREIDPTHLIAARTGYGGTGQMGIDPRMPFDLISGAKHLDFISPEGYGLSPDWEKARAAGFTTLYGRYAGNGKPVFWAEFGQSVHPSYDEAAFARQRNIYESMYHLVLDSFAQGSAGWWFPGGYRLGENSDYGIISPDMTPRPSAEVLARYTPAITRQPPVPSPDAWITIDRDLHPRGYSMIRRRHEAEYVRLRSQGKVVGLRTPATGTTSATVPDVAVGNVPYTGSNPHKYLNAEFNWVRLVMRDGSKVKVSKGQTVTLPKGEPVRLEVSVANTGEPTWLSPRGDRLAKGDVHLLCSVNSQPAPKIPLQRNVSRYEDYEFRGLLVSAALRAPIRVTLRMEAFSKARFAEKFEFSVLPD